MDVNNVRIKLHQCNILFHILPRAMPFRAFDCWQFRNGHIVEPFFDFYHRFATIYLRNIVKIRLLRRDYNQFVRCCFVARLQPLSAFQLQSKTIFGRGQAALIVILAVACAIQIRLGRRQING